MKLSQVTSGRPHSKYRAELGLCTPTPCSDAGSQAAREGGLARPIDTPRVLSFGALDSNRDKNRLLDLQYGLKQDLVPRLPQPGCVPMCQYRY